MGTTADKLELLLRTKERQKAYLQQKYPLLDFDTIPFRAYLDLFQGRSYVPGLVAAWKTYGKRNDDADRDVLYDYSGNGRDIKLYNFAFSGMSGYGGYGCAKWTAYGAKAEQTSGNVVNISLESSADYGCGVLPLAIYKGESVKIRYKITGYQEGCHLRAYTNTRNAEGTVVPTIVRTITADGIYEDTFEWDSENAATDSTGSQVFIICEYFRATSAINMTIEQLPLYPGALVSDGIDDYGKCIKDFALPDDYTVVAVRRNINKNNTCLINKSSTAGQGAFIFEMGTNRTYSYGQATYIELEPALFSYQTKTSYNGTPITPGSGVDSDSKIELFRLQYNSKSHAAIALFDVRLYNHTLTAEEFQIVKDQMLSDFENATGGGYN